MATIEIGKKKFYVKEETLEKIEKGLDILVKVGIGTSILSSVFLIGYSYGKQDGTNLGFALGAAAGKADVIDKILALPGQLPK